MGRHSLPDGPTAKSTGARPGPRRRTIVLSTGLVLAVAAGSVVAVRSGLLPFGGRCDGPSVRIAVAASPDIAPAVEAMADTAREKATRTDGRCLDVRVVARPSHELADSFGQRPADPEFQVWIPDSSLWVDRVEAESGTPLTAAGTIASSPLTLGAVPKAAKSLGWPNKRYTWAGLTRSATSSGDLRLGVADPTRSATGLLALSRISAANTEDAGDGDEADTRTAATAKLLYQRVADGDDQVMATLPRDNSGAEQGNPRRNQALMLSEQAAFAHNESSDGGPDLDLFYPEDGTARLDYPYALVDEDEMSPEQSRAASRFMTLLGEPDGQRALHEHGFRTGDGRADAEVLAAAGGRDPQPYNAAPADPPTAKQLQALLGMWTITVQSARISTVVDASASMGNPVPGRGGQTRMDLARNSLLQALATFTPEDEIGLWKFATHLDGEKDYQELSPTGRLGDPEGGDGTHRDALAAAFGSLAPVPHGATGLYDTVLAAYEEARRTYTSGKFNAVVLVTDGANDDASSIGLDALVTKLGKLSDPGRPVPLIAVAIGPEADASALDRIVAPTGGSVHRVDDPSQIHQVILKAIMAAGSKAPR
ncbi:substrate-binding and VWA domain-containing protein [Streptomyces sp. NRRL S-1448]|uniref:substrate-binding and VWA domain-containing protein n=1 Tax=Streptomyces sp. NRRL S-1448 TaxID=1463883 RepID=UPI0004C1FE87|nr:substrate-binding and VWA domain-containing protein [Streptomyces sp. NRRL S-1448]